MRTLLCLIYTFLQPTPNYVLVFRCLAYIILKTCHYSNLSCVLSEKLIFCHHRLGLVDVVFDDCRDECGVCTLVGWLAEGERSISTHTHTPTVTHRPQLSIWSIITRLSDD